MTAVAFWFVALIDRYGFWRVLAVEITGLVAAWCLLGAAICLTRRAIAAVARTRRINHAVDRWITTADDTHLDTIRKEQP